MIFYWGILLIFLSMCSKISNNSDYILCCFFHREVFDLTLLIIILLCFVFIVPPIISMLNKPVPNWLFLALFVSAIILAILMTLKIK